MSLFVLPPMIAFVFILGIGLFVYIKNPKVKTNWTFSLFCLSMVVWLFGFINMYLSPNTAVALQWARFGFLGVIFVPITEYHFIVSLIGRPVKKWIIPLLYLSAIPSIILSRTNLIYKDIGEYFWGYYPIAGPLYFIFLLMFAFLFSYGVLLLFIEFRRLLVEKAHLKAQQIKYVLIAFAGGTTGIMDYIIKYEIEIYPYGYVSASFLLFVIAYAITKHHLLDIEIVIKRGLIYSIVTALLTGFFVSFILIWNFIFSGLTDLNTLWGGIIATFVIAFAFQYLRDNVQRVVDQRFFRSRYDYQRILNRYSHALAQPMADLGRFARIVPYLIVKSMKLTGASFMVLDRQSGAYIVRSGLKESAHLEGYSLLEQSPLIQEIRRTKKELILDEIEEKVKTAQGHKKEKYQQIIAEMKRLKAVLIIPSVSEGQYFKKPTLISTINLGIKLSDEAFSSADIQFLKTLANQASISIEAAFMLEEIRKNQERVIKSEKLATIGTTTAGIAHELKNPLTYLNTLAQILPLKWDDKEFRLMVSKMLPLETQRMQLIVEGLLNYSRSRELTLKPLEVTTVIEKAIALMTYEGRKKSVEIKTDYNHGKQINGDPNRLMQVFVNMLGNAIQAMEEKGGTITIVTQGKPGFVDILIKDQGKGMPQEEINRIFDPFFTTKESGTGLGLSISKKIIDEHKGSVTVESQANQGTTFIISLPVAA